MESSEQAQDWCKKCKSPKSSTKHQKHLVTKRKADKARYDKRRMANTRNYCIDCDAPKDSEKHRNHLDLKGISIKKRYQAKIAETGPGFCFKCNDYNTSEKHQLHAEKLKGWREGRSARRLTKGLCVICGDTKDSAKHLKCKKRNNNGKAARNAKRFALNLCLNCGGTKESEMSASKLCLDCHVKRAASGALGSQKDWEKLKEKLIQQQFKCSYTGEPLILGETASIDHLIPKCRDGPRTVENTHWVIKDINLQYKNWLSHENFLDLCRATWLRKEKGELLDQRDLVLAQIWDYQLRKS